MSLLSRACDLVAARIGLHFPENRWRDIERGLAAAGRELGQRNLEQFVEQLVSLPPTAEQLEVLARHLTIGETYFFREKESLRVLEERIVPELLQSRAAGGRRVRIWSAGSSSGEEAYSIAMILERVIPDIDSWDVKILATDINQAFLEKARRGVYTRWSFRTTPDDVRDRFFQRRSEKQWEVLPSIRRRVTFAHLNLATDPYPSPANGTEGMDVIFCRNVLMYFSSELRQKVVERFYRSLVPGGWLIVSASETSDRIYSQFEAERSQTCTLYRKSDPARVPTPRTNAPHLVPLAAPIKSVATAATTGRAAKKNRQVSARTVVARAVPRVSAPTEIPPATLQDTARRLANDGRLDEAAEASRNAIAEEKMDPARHYLLAAIQRELGALDDAAQSLQRTLYLDPGFVLAHFAMANLDIARGRMGDAERHLRNTLAALRTHPPDEVLPESDGLTAARLNDIVTELLAALSSRVRPSERSRA